MDNDFRADTKTKLKGLAYYQIAGGVLGLCLTIWFFANAITTVSFIILVVAGGLYSFSIFCGQQLLKGDTIKGLRLSTINQALQTINLAVLGYAFKYVAGLIVSVGLDLTDGYDFTFNFSLSEFQLNYNKHKDLATVGLNLVALYLIYFIGRLRDDIEKQRNTTHNIGLP